MMPMSGAKDRAGSAPEHEGATSVEARFAHPISPVDRIDEEVGVAKLLQNLGLSDDDDARMPLQIGRFEILERIGAGGMSQVYKARDPELERVVAIKVLNGKMAAYEAERLRAEGNALAQFKDRHIVTVHEVGVHGDEFFLVLEYIEGASLDAWRRASRRPLGEILGVLIQVGRALDTAHRAGIIHRDVKPQNILVREGELSSARGRRSEPSAHVVDFGLVRVEGGAGAARGLLLDGRMTATGALVGTPLYMAPEQADREGPISSALSDQYSFAVVLYEAVFDERPHRGSGEQVLEAIRRDPPAQPRLGSVEERMLWRVLRRGLAKDPGARFPTMAAMAAELEAIRTWRSRWTLRGGVAAAMAMTAVMVTLLLPSAAEANLGACRQRGAAIAGKLIEGAPGENKRLGGKIEGFGERLGVAWEAACKDEHEPERRATAQGDPGKTRACLERVGASVQRDLKQLGDATGEVRRVIEENLLLGELPSVEECARAGSWRGTVGGALGDGERKALATAIDNARQAQLLDDAELAIAELEKVSVEAAAVGEPRAQAQAELAIARMIRLNGVGDLAEVPSHLDAAKNAAIEANDDVLVAWVLLEKARVYALGDEPDEARVALDEARSLARRVQDDLSEGERRRMEAVLHEVEGLCAYAEEDFKGSVEHLKAAHKLIEARDTRDGGFVSETSSFDDAIVRATILINLGRSLTSAGRVDEGLQVTREAIDREIEIFGGVHSELAEGLMGAAVDLYKNGKSDDAKRLAQDAIDIAGSERRRIHARLVLAQIAQEQKRYGEVIEQVDLVMSSAKANGLDHEWVQGGLLKAAALYADRPGMCQATLDYYDVLAASQQVRGAMGRDGLLDQILDARMKIALGCERYDLVLADFERRKGLMANRGREVEIEKKALRAQALAGQGSPEAQSALAAAVADFRANGTPAESMVFYDTVLSLASVLEKGKGRVAACEFVRSLEPLGEGDQVREWLREHCE